MAFARLIELLHLPCEREWQITNGLKINSPERRPEKIFSVERRVYTDDSNASKDE